MKQSADKILKECMGLSENESCLIVTDKNKLDIADVLLQSAKGGIKSVCMQIYL